MAWLVFVLVLCNAVNGLPVRHQPRFVSSTRLVRTYQRMTAESVDSDSVDGTPPRETPTPAVVTSKQYDVSSLASNKGGAGAGFNQFDPILTLSGFVSRRFGLAGGLAVVALIASTEGVEILKSFQDTGPVLGGGEQALPLTYATTVLVAL